MTGKPNPRFVITERRERVSGFITQGLNETEIAEKLNVGQSTVVQRFQSTQQRITEDNQDNRKGLLSSRI